MATKVNKIIIELNDESLSFEDGYKAYGAIKELHRIGFQIECKVDGSAISMASALHALSKKDPGPPKFILPNGSVGV